MKKIEIGRRFTDAPRKVTFVVGSETYDYERHERYYNADELSNARIFKAIGMYSNRHDFAEQVYGAALGTPISVSSESSWPSIPREVTNKDYEKCHIAMLNALQLKVDKYNITYNPEMCEGPRIGNSILDLSVRSVKRIEI